MLPALPTSSPNEKSPPLSSESWVPVNTFSATIKQLDRITREGWYQDVRHIEFEFEDPISSILFLFFLYEQPAEKAVVFHRYKPGDIALLYPCTTPEHVESLMACMQWTAFADRPHHIIQVSSGLSLIYTLPLHIHPTYQFYQPTHRQTSSAQHAQYRDIKGTVHKTPGHHLCPASFVLREDQRIRAG
jgi:sulfite reductase alpha subunit-like flavoprotein